MAIYHFVQDGDRYDYLESSVRLPWDYFIEHFNGRSLAEEWQPLAVKTVRAQERGGYRGDVDFPSFPRGAPVFSLRALAVMEPLIGDDVEVLPLGHPKKVFYAINVLTVLDCIDYERAVVARSPSGRVMDIEQYAFKPGSIAGRHIFKIKDFEVMEPYVSEEFKRRVVESGLIGARFLEVPEVPGADG